MFLVGGFAESPMLQFEIKKEFNHLLKIIIPQDVGLTILKGNCLEFSWIGVGLGGGEWSGGCSAQYFLLMATGKGFHF